MSDRLAEICNAKRAHVAVRKAETSLRDLDAAIAAQSAPRGFRAALDAKVAAGSYGLIAEIKKASPSKGLIRQDFDPPSHARAYAEGGAACLSVLTDAPYFQGSDDYLRAARAAVTLPCLRKDFIVDPWQVAESRALGADAILIIVAALDDGAMAEIEAAARAQGMDALIEVHDAPELERALRLMSKLIGFNNRDLKDFSVDLQRSEELISQLPPEFTAVAESGLTTKSDLDRLAAKGIGCFLVGEALMRQEDVTLATQRLLGTA